MKTPLVCSTTVPEVGSLGFGWALTIAQIIPHMPPGKRSDKSVRRGIKAGEIPARKIGSRWMLSLAEVTSRLLEGAGARDRLIVTLDTMDQERREKNWWAKPRHPRPRAA